jgi:sulfite exporter TauE/SafE
MEFVLAAITLGFLGSFHCIGMCGPIALALPVHTAKPAKKILLILSYNFGRIVTYSLFGAAAGVAGQSLVVGGYQQILSVAMGIIILLMVFFPKKKSNLFQAHIFSFFNSIKNQLRKLFLKNGHGPLFTIGLLNGFLPCGLVYISMAGAVATGDLVSGALFMAFFGLGTVPVMLSLPLAGEVVSVNARNKIRKTVPIIVGAMAVLLILRGLNLGIPYLSPKINDPSAVSCHLESLPPQEHIIKCSKGSH